MSTIERRSLHCHVSRTEENFKVAKKYTGKQSWAEGQEGKERGKTSILEEQTLSWPVLEVC